LDEIWTKSSQLIAEKVVKFVHIPMSVNEFDNLEYYKPLLKAEKSISFNDLLKLTRESKKL